MKITKEDYLKKKLQEDEEFKKLPRKNYCFNCVRPKSICFCHKLLPISPKISVVILIHPMEAKKEKMGTGRLTQLSLKNSKLIMGIDFTNDPEVNSLINNSQNSCYLLYPGENSIDLSQPQEFLAQTSLKEDYDLKKNVYVFVIDGTWPCAKKMMKLSKNLHGLKRISFKVDKPSAFRIKEQPGEFCLSTVESVHLMLKNLVDKGFEEPLENLDHMLKIFNEMVEFQVKCAEDPDLPSYKRSKKAYKTPEERVRSKKWENRKIIF